jgi:GDSL-like Lipase/Acylhydrolase family
MPRLLRVTWITICIVSFCISLPVVLSGSLRSTFLLTIYRKVAWIWPHEYASIGDSLINQCSWQLQLEKPFSIVNLAEGGQGINGVTQQIVRAREIGAKYLFIATGINDIILEHTPIDQITYNFALVLRKIGPNQKAVVTLIPYVTDPAYSPAIREANIAIRSLAENRGLAVIDLNPDIAPNGIRKSEMTTDGVHFSPQACSVWIAAIRAKINYFKMIEPAFTG